MAIGVFWISLALLFYTFIGYPIVIWLLARFTGKESALRDGFTPKVSLILSAYNEEAVISQKIENFLSLDYPEELIEFVIISDRCEDGTEEIIRAFDNPRIKLLVQEERGGKTRALNRGASAAQGEILIFTDANSMFDSDAVQKLVRHFADPAIGLVSGKSVYVDPASGGTTTGGAYRRYEDFIKKGESRVVSIVGADGAIYALRKSIYEPLRPEYINDFIHTIQTVLGGYRAVSDDEAICREETDESGSDEFRRQTRIMAQSWLIFLSQVGKLLAVRALSYVWAVVSHKLLRWLTVPLMLLLLISSPLLVSRGILYQVVFGAEIFLGVLIVSGTILKKGVARLAYLFLLLHLAALFGLYKLLCGNVYTTWSPRNN